MTEKSGRELWDEVHSRLDKSCGTVNGIDIALAQASKRGYSTEQYRQDILEVDGILQNAFDKMGEGESEGVVVGLIRKAVEKAEMFREDIEEEPVWDVKVPEQVEGEYDSLGSYVDHFIAELRNVLGYAREWRDS